MIEAGHTIVEERDRRSLRTFAATSTPGRARHYGDELTLVVNALPAYARFRRRKRRRMYEQVFARTREMLERNGLEPAIARHLTVVVGKDVPTQASTRAWGEGTRYTHFSAVVYLRWPVPEWAVSHEMGHVRTLRALYLSHQGSWTGYLAARDLDTEPRLDSEYQWDRKEIIADDWRCLFGSPAARSHHFNPYVVEPQDVPDFPAYLADWERVT